MTFISQDDWDALSAYSDGELPAADSSLLEARLQTEPELQDALTQIQTIGQSLKALRPELTPAVVPVQTQRPKQIYRYSAIAASIVLALVFTGQTIFDLKSTDTPSDQHQAFLQQDFIVQHENIQAVNSRNDIPDLTSANLALVANVTNRNNGQALHYAGRNGCRLTLTITKGAPPSVKVTPELLLASWSVAPVHYTLLATGMDGDRFAAISKFVRVHFEQQNSTVTLTAMQETTETAAPCWIA